MGLFFLCHPPAGLRLFFQTFEAFFLLFFGKMKPKFKDQSTFIKEHPLKANNIAFRCNEQYFASAPDSVPPRRWIHIAFVRQAGTAISYINGVPSGEPQDMSKVGDLSNSLPFQIGRRPFERSPAWFAGMIDDLRVYARALSADEIRHLATMEQP